MFLEIITETFDINEEYNVMSLGLADFSHSLSANNKTADTDLFFKKKIIFQFCYISQYILTVQ